MNIRHLPIVLLAIAALELAGPISAPSWMLLSLTFLMFAIVFAGLSKVPELAQALQRGWRSHLLARVADTEVDAHEVERWAVIAVFAAGAIAFAYWISVGALVSRDLALAGAIVWLADFAFNRELLRYFLAHPFERHDESAARRLVWCCYALAAIELSTLAASVAKILIG